MNFPQLQAAADRPCGPLPAVVMANALPGWRRIGNGPAVLWFKGHLFGDGERRLLQACREGYAALECLLPTLDGCFGLIVEDQEFTLAAADPIGSIPLFVADCGNAVYRVAGSATELLRAGRLADIDRDAALAIGMGGFVLAERALIKGIRHLRAGEMAILRAGATPVFGFHTRYRPWRAAERPRAILSDELADVLRAGFSKALSGLGDRPIMVPLSAGYDSRLVAAALKELGHRDIRCYAYGIPGNHEAKVSRVIAERLGLPWRFVPVTPAIQGAYFASAEHAEFARANDTLTAIPFNQDYAATRSVLADGYAPKDAVFINGQSGDFITGNHVPQELWSPAAGDVQVRWSRLFAAARRKHFGLWDVLQTRRNLARMEAMFREDIETRSGLPADPALDWTLAEASELIHRQSRYVVAGQRTYEHFGADWRLPLWDRDLVAFYETAPLSAKRSQSLYRETLCRLNWGGVFGDDIPVNRRNVRPLWLAPVRFAAKVAMAPFGRAAWHAVERRAFAWHMDPVANYAVARWFRVARDRRGFRNAISWHAEAYLSRHGITLDELATLR